MMKSEWVLGGLLLALGLTACGGDDEPAACWVVLGGGSPCQVAWNCEVGHASDLEMSCREKDVSGSKMWECTCKEQGAQTAVFTGDVLVCDATDAAAVTKLANMAGAGCKFSKPVQGYLQ